MRKRVPKILVTGGAGFIGSAFARRAARENYRTVVVDKLTYAGDLRRLDEIKNRYIFHKVDICESKKLETVFKKESPDIVINFAASTHVDRSIQDPTPFSKTNYLGTQLLLDISRRHGIKKFVHISSDEVYGEIDNGSFTEDSALKPNSPYAASKAAADLLIRSYIRTYGIPAIIIRPSNNYGCWQYPEKLIPLSILKILRNEKIPVYGNGRNIREWLYVDDCAEGILRILEKGRTGEIYNLGGREEKHNIDVARMILEILHKDKNLIEFVEDRPGHDRRYSLDSHKVHEEIRWKPRLNFEDGLRITVLWSLEHKDWLLCKWKNILPLLHV